MRRMRVFLIAAAVAGLWVGALYYGMRGMVEGGGLRCFVLVMWEGKAPEGCKPL